MKQSILIILLTLLSSSISFGQLDDGMYKAFAQIVEGEQRAHRGLLRFRESGTGDNIDIHHIKAYWEINPSILYIRGYVRFDFEARELLNDITLDLADSMQIDSILYQGKTISFTHDHNILTMQLNGVLRLGDRASIKVFYQGVPAQSGFGSFQQATHGPDSIPIIWTLSEPYGASEWWPCKNSLTDKIDSTDIYINTHVRWKAASNGLLVETLPNPSGMDVTYHWKHRYPIAPYLISLAVSDYTVFSDTLQSISGRMLPIQNFAYPERLADAMDGTSKVPSMIAFYEDTIAEYPFNKEKYGHAQFGWGGGMEHQTMTSVGGYNYGLLAHELSHQWFGDAVTCKSWSDIWLNEGFATYMTALMERHAFGEDVFERWLTNTADRITNNPDGSVWVDDTTTVGRIFSGRLSYRKGAYVLHMLRGVIGDEAFFKGIRSYLKDNMYGYATTDDLRMHLEAAADTTLNGFFDDWFYGEGYPTYHVKVLMEDIGNEYKITVSQTQSNPSVFFYEMPIQLKLINTTFGVDTLITLQNTYNNQVFFVYTPTPNLWPIDSMVVDPNHWILTGKNTTEIKLELSTKNPYDGHLSLSPNPVSHTIHLKTDYKTTDFQSIEVWNSYGRHYPAGTIDQWFQGKDVSQWTPGSYFLLLRMKNGQRISIHFSVNH